MTETVTEQKNFHTLMLIPSVLHQQKVTNILKKNAGIKNIKCIMASFNFPFKTITQMYKEQNIPIENLLFVDCMNNSSKPTNENKEQFLSIDSPENITGLAIAIGESLYAIKEEKFIFLDSVDTMLIYHNEIRVAKFLHFLINKAKETNTSSIILAGKNLNQQIIDQVEQFVDSVIEE